MTTDSVTESVLDISQDNNLSLNHVISILSMKHDEPIVLDLVRQFCLQSNKDEIMKTGMEFLYMNGCYDDLQQLINKNEKSTRTNVQWAAVYQLLLDRKFNRFPPPVLLRNATSLPGDEPEIKCLLEFVKISIHYDMHNFGELGDFLDTQQHLFAEVTDPFLLSFFNIRLYEILFTYYWVRNELIMARKYAFRVLNLTQNPRTKVAMNVNLALTYTFDTYEQGMHHLQEALVIAKKHRLVEIIQIIQNLNIPFLSAFHQRIEGITTSDPSEQAHIEIVKGNLKKAESILRKLPLNSPFELYYLGLATHNKDLLHQSYTFFVSKRSDHFFCRLPMLALQNMGA